MLRILLTLILSLVSFQAYAANYYVRSGAGGLNDGTSWANAYTTLTTALSGKTNADVLWVANDHAESTVGAVTLALPTTPGLRILGVNTNATEPPTDLVASGSPTATVAVGASNAALTITGFGYINGIIFQGSTNNSGTAVIVVGNATSPLGITFDNCQFQLRSVSISVYTLFGAANSGSSDDSIVSLNNVKFKFGNASQRILPQHGNIYMKNISIDGTGSTPTSLFIPGAGAATNVKVESSDLSGVSFTNLVNFAAATPAMFLFRNCEIPSGVNIVTGTNPGPGGSIVRLHNCDSTDTNYRFAEHSYFGSVVQQTGTIIKTGGASDGTTGISWKMTNTRDEMLLPLESPEISVWSDTTGSKTVTVDIVYDSATNFQNDEVWLECQSMNTSGFPLGTITSSRMTNVFSSPADLDSSTASWGTTGFTNENKDKLSVTFTTAEKGVISCKVNLAKNAVIYVDPLLQIQ